MQCVDADTLISNLTVFEMLLYTAELKLPRWMSYRDKVCKVATIIQQLALTTCQHVRIGSAVQRGISGERLQRMHLGKKYLPCKIACAATVAKKGTLTRQSSTRQASNGLYSQAGAIFWISGISSSRPSLNSIYYETRRESCCHGEGAAMVKEETALEARAECYEYCEH